jgi:haloacetate dehalogenase
VTAGSRTVAATGPIAGAEYDRCRVGDVDYLFARAGSGDPVLLLHGFPETHYCWRALLPTLAESHTVVAPDLRGYGGTRAGRRRAR